MHQSSRSLLISSGGESQAFQIPKKRYLYGAKAGFHTYSAFSKAILIKKSKYFQIPIDMVGNWMYNPSNILDR